MVFKRQRGLLWDENGQIILIVVLVMVIALTIGLSVAARGIMGLRTSTEEADSQRALAAAETGIERSVQEIQPIPLATSVPDTESSTVTNSKYSTGVKAVEGSTFLINGGLEVSKDEGADVWFVNHVGGNPDYSTPSNPDKVNLFWGSSTSGCNEAAIEVIVVTRDPSTSIVKTYRYAYDPCSLRIGNNFTPALAGIHSITGSTFTFGTPPNNDLTENIASPKNIVFMRVIPLYQNARIGVYACNGGICTLLPVQGYQITSTGTSGDASRTVSVFKGWPQTYLPYLSYGLFVAKDR